MKIDTKNISKTDSYKLLTGCIEPRPIAWITTLSPEGRINLAPFALFIHVSIVPPKLMFGISRQKPEFGGHNGFKDTERNITHNKEYVIHIPSAEFATEVERSADYYPADVSEVELLGLKTEPSDFVKVPRLSDVPIAMECVLTETVSFSSDQLLMVIGEIKMFHVRDDCIKDNRVDSFKVNPLMRIAGPNYATLGKHIYIEPSGPGSHRPYSLEKILPNTLGT